MLYSTTPFFESQMCLGSSVPFSILYDFCIFPLKNHLQVLCMIFVHCLHQLLWLNDRTGQTFPSKGQSFFFLQLHSSSCGFWWSLLIMQPLWDLTIELTFFIQLYETFTVFLLKVLWRLLPFGKCLFIIRLRNFHQEN